MRTRHFKDLIAWQQAMQLTRNIYLATNAFPKDETFGLRAQIRRAAVSVPSNIAEGHGRLSNKLFRTFLAQARGSLYEVETQLILSADVGYLPQEQVSELLRSCDGVARLINALLRSLKNRKVDETPTR